jgi:hypothetical protein
METKTCTKCEKELPKTLEYFYTCRGIFISSCKECKKIVTKKYLENNKEQINLKGKEYYKNNREKRIVEMKEYNKIHYQDNKEYYKEKDRLYSLNNKEKIFAKNKKYYNKNRIRGRNKTKELTDYYIKNHLLKTKEFVPKEIIETKRLLMQLKRELKTIKN